MKNRLVLVLAIASAGVIFLVQRARQSGLEGNDPRAGWFRHPEEHKVTSEMLSQAAKLVDTQAQRFHVLASDGATYDLDQLVKDRPVVLLFIKEDCPCSTEAQPFFNRMHAAYGEKVAFLGVIDGGEAVAREWARRRKPGFPLLCDPDLEIVRQYKALNSVYVALVVPGGKVSGFWPGFSAKMLEELSVRLAELTHEPRKPIDTTDAPDEMVSGCPYPAEPEPGTETIVH
jgi:peroxiredoxin